MIFDCGLVIVRTCQWYRRTSALCVEMEHIWPKIINYIFNIKYIIVIEVIMSWRLLRIEYINLYKLLHIFLSLKNIIALV